MRAINITVWGDVQGVSYRYHAKKMALSLELTGNCYNSRDGSVKIFIQGDREKLDTFLSWVNEGSPMATVNRVDIAETKVDESIKGFEVK